MPPFFKTAGDFLRGDRTKRDLAATTVAKENIKRFLAYTEKAMARTRQDIASWNNAIAMARSDDPKNFALQLLFEEIEIDALLTSQIQNRVQQVLSRPFQLVNEAGDVDEEETIALGNRAVVRKLIMQMMSAVFNGYSLTELNVVRNAKGEDIVEVYPIPPTNVVPKKGLFYPDYTEDKKIEYRKMKEYGTYFLEFDTSTMGLLNKAVPHVLFRRFAQSCWSELCEIYGIPPRVLKTNTQDTTMLRRAEKMMADMGAAAWFIVDETESLTFSTGTSTDGAVYQNLINLCSNEISLLISGAVVGQDTVNGSRSKEEASQEMLTNLVKADLVMVTDWMNTIALPALVTLGIVPAGLRWKFEAAEDLTQLWKITKEALQFYNVDADWVKNKFGVEITGERETATGTPPGDKQNNSFDPFV